MSYISVRNWRRFQHYQDRTPPWIKVYTELHSDDAYLDLSSHCRALLLDLWIEYARSRRHLPDNTASLSRRFGYRVMRRDLEALVLAGFIDIVASTALAEGYQDARPEVLLRKTQERASARALNGSRSRSEKKNLPPCPECGTGGGVHILGCSLANLVRDIDEDVPF